jgi:Caspase domain
MPNKAIIVGIRKYPELPPELEGPGNDAVMFRDWVTTHGGVAAVDARLILGDDPPPPSALNANPTEQAIQYEFDQLATLAEAGGGCLGDRLYIYLSGHGFGQSLNDAALLMANATMRRPYHHIPGRLWADHFFVNGYFKEVILFLDCCRERYNSALLNGPGYLVPPVPPAGARRFYGFATKFGKLAVERKIDGIVHGVFTATLMKALTGGAAEQDGKISAASLKAFLFENMKNFLEPQDLQDQDVAKEPDVFCDPPEDEFVIATFAPEQFTITIPLPPGAENKPRKLFNDKFAKIRDCPANGTLHWVVKDIMRGTYQMLVDADTYIVTVNGRGATDVTAS